jgi:hypothetical protein
MVREDNQAGQDIPVGYGNYQRYRSKKYFCWQPSLAIIKIAGGRVMLDILLILPRHVIMIGSTYFYSIQQRHHHGPPKNKGGGLRKSR